MLSGGSGNDWLEGGAGNDTMQGDLGADDFVFDLAANAGARDVIADFDASEDRLHLASSGESLASLLGQAVQQGSDVHFAFADGAELWVAGVDLAALEARTDLL